MTDTPREGTMEVMGYRHMSGNVDDCQFSGFHRYCSEATTDFALVRLTDAQAAIAAATARYEALVKAAEDVRDIGPRVVGMLDHSDYTGTAELLRVAVEDLRAALARLNSKEV